RREDAAVVLLEADGGCVAGGDVEVEHRGRGTQTETARRIDEDRVGRRAAGDRKWHGRRGDVLDRELVGPAGSRVVAGQLPVVIREAGAGAGVVELDPGVVLLQPDGVEA